MEFDLLAFANDIRQNLYDNFPFESDEIKDKKHKSKPLHIRDIAFMYLPITQDQNSIMFEIGSDYAEENYPYYHILEDSQVIRKKGKANKTSRGSQAEISELSKRDYGHINFNGKTYSREYERNTRGKGTTFSYGKHSKATRYYDGSKWVYGVSITTNVSKERSRIGTATKVVVGSNGKAYRVNPNANYYVNKHYQYIERTLNMVLPWIAQANGMRMGRTEITDLSSEYQEQESALRIMNIMSSFEEE